MLFPILKNGIDFTLSNYSFKIIILHYENNNQNLLTYYHFKSDF